MTEALRTFGFTLQNSDTPLRAYLEATDQTPLVQADLAGGTITRKVFDLESNTPLTATESDELTASAVIFDTLQAWQVDSIGYNIRDVVPGSYFPLAERRYEVQYKFELSGGSVLYTKPFEIKTVRTF
jgi:hypothetical protein